MTSLGYQPSFTAAGQVLAAVGRDQLVAGGGWVRRFRGNRVWRLPDVDRVVERALLSWLVGNPVAAGVLAGRTAGQRGRDVVLLRELLGPELGGGDRRRWWSGRAVPRRDFLAGLVPWLPAEFLSLAVPSAVDADGVVTAWMVRFLPQDVDLLAQVASQRSAFDVHWGAGLDGDSLVVRGTRGEYWWVPSGGLLVVSATSLDVRGARVDAEALAGVAQRAGVPVDFLVEIVASSPVLSLPDAVVGAQAALA